MSGGTDDCAAAKQLSWLKAALCKQHRITSTVSVKARCDVSARSDMGVAAQQGRARRTRQPG